MSSSRNLISYADYQLIKEYDENYAWLQIPKCLHQKAKEITEEDLDMYWYEVCYHPDDDSVYVAIVGDVNAETLQLNDYLIDKIKRRFK